MGNEGFTVENLRTLGNPKTIIDVGVAWYTQALYEAFPDKNILLIEPLAEKFMEPGAGLRVGINHILTSYKHAQLAPVAAGSCEKTMDIHIHDQLGQSSLVPNFKTENIKSVKVRTVDSVVKELGLKGSYGIKIDAEGYELEVVKGCEKILRYTQFLIIEVWNEDVIDFLKSKRFEVVQKLGKGPFSEDLVFKRVR